MSFGPERGEQLLIVPPLFEELNRTRKLISDVMRALAARAIGTHLPDLPGTGESEKELGDVAWPDWRYAVADAATASGATRLLAIRGGCLLDDALPARPHMRFSPVEGKRLIRDLIRARSLTDDDFDSDAQKTVFAGQATMLGGYPIGASLACSFRDAVYPALDDVMTVRLETEHGDADAKIAGPPLWRRAEPRGSAELTETLAVTIIDWTG